MDRRSHPHARHPRRRLDNHLTSYFPTNRKAISSEVAFSIAPNRGGKERNLNILNKGKPKHMKPRRRWRTPLTALAVAVSMAFAPAAMADLNGYDVSGYQAPDITQVAPADFAIVKVNQGWYINSSWGQQASGAVNTGKELGLYDYASGMDATTEADNFVNHITGYVGKAMLVLDWEPYQNAAWGNSNWVRTWVYRVHARTGVWPVVYCSKGFVGQIPADVRAKCMLWAAQYANNYATGYQDSPWLAGSQGEGMLQYTSTGYLNGRGPLDLDKFFGDRTAWRKIACGERAGCSTTGGSTGTPTIHVEKRTTNTTDLNAMATAVIRGDYGNGADRQARLGDNYQAVMNIVNSRLSSSAYSGPTTVTRTKTRTYVVRSGDTVSAIAERTGLKPVSAWRVPSGDVNRIYPGQIVTYGGASVSTASSGVGGHVVRSGESLWSIYGSGWQSAAARNGIRSPYVIYPGQYLR